PVAAAAAAVPEAPQQLGCSPSPSAPPPPPPQQLTPPPQQLTPPPQQLTPPPPQLGCSPSPSARVHQPLSQGPVLPPPPALEAQALPAAAAAPPQATALSPQDLKPAESGLASPSDRGRSMPTSLKWPPEPATHASCDANPLHTPSPGPQTAVDVSPSLAAGAAAVSSTRRRSKSPRSLAALSATSSASAHGKRTKRGNACSPKLTDGDMGAKRRRSATEVA
ncbi:hypothetical protein QJQ45_021645, partial [Haematococcus lacustris]